MPAAGMQALASIGLQSSLPIAMDDFVNGDKRDDWLRNHNMLLFPLWDPVNPLRSVDVFVDEPVNFVALLADSVVKELDGYSVRIASIPHLIAMKRRAGRPRDLDDIYKLQQNHADAQEVRRDAVRPLSFSFEDAERAQLVLKIAGAPPAPERSGT